MPKIVRTRCSTYAARQWMIAYNSNNVRNPLPTSFITGLRVLLLYAIIHCLAAYVLHLVCKVFGTAIPTLFNILMKMFLLLLLYDRPMTTLRGIGVCLPHPHIYTGSVSYFLWATPNNMGRLGHPSVHTGRKQARGRASSAVYTSPTIIGST